jgi:surface protein
MIDTRDKTTTLYSYQNGIGANTEAILTRTLRHILYGNLYVNGGNGGNGGEIPSDEMHFTTLAGSVDYVGTQGDQILLSDNSVVDITATDETVTFNAPSGRHVVKLVESVGRNNYVSVGGEALVELHNFPTLSTVTSFNFSTYKYNPLTNLTKVPNFLPSNIINVEGLFSDATNFNQDLNNWNVSNVTNMNGMFAYATSFNQDLNNWNVSNVTDMNYMFYNATSFNQPLNNWNVSNVTNMNGVFGSATSFNQPLNNWNVSNVTNMASMFYNATSFNQDLSMWCVSNIPILPIQFDIDATNWTLPRPVWGTCPSP